MQKQNGFIAISMVILLVALVIAISTTVALLAVGEAESALTLTNGESTLSFVEGCTEDALLKARANTSYAGGNITRPEGTCTVTISKAGSIWTLTVSTTATVYVRTIQVVITQDGYGDTISSWSEI
ncbi:MAG TPA: hypothetical protein VNW29_03865 [Candidatus Sulfotelmatobacter sp.]|jgi:hypothetical protein|nr:hypothetical protein [Candidatus Sulfotelmatobacter sp.]